MLGLGNCVYFPQSNAIYAQVKQPTKEVKGIVVDEKGEISYVFKLLILEIS